MIEIRKASFPITFDGDRPFPRVGEFVTDRNGDTWRITELQAAPPNTPLTLALSGFVQKVSPAAFATHPCPVRVENEGDTLPEVVRRCASCGRREDEHNVRHMFVAAVTKEATPPSNEDREALADKVKAILRAKLRMRWPCNTPWCLLRMSSEPYQPGGIVGECTCGKRMQNL